MNKKQQCGNCYFVYKSTRTPDYTECRKHAPKANDFLTLHYLELIRDLSWSLRIMSRRTDTLLDCSELNTESWEVTNFVTWPVVMETEWCGEWEPEEKKDA